jgi:hypothetical protein
MRVLENGGFIKVGSSGFKPTLNGGRSKARCLEFVYCNKKKNLEKIYITV